MPPPFGVCGWWGKRRENERASEQTAKLARQVTQISLPGRGEQPEADVSFHSVPVFPSQINEQVMQSSVLRRFGTECGGSAL